MCDYAQILEKVTRLIDFRDYDLVVVDEKMSLSTGLKSHEDLVKMFEAHSDVISIDSGQTLESQIALIDRGIMEQAADLNFRLPTPTYE